MTPKFDAFYRKLLSGVCHSLGAEAPDALAEPIKHINRNGRGPSANPAF